jgi:integrase
MTMTIPTSITRRERKRVLTSGLTVSHQRYVLNFRDPRSGKRRQLFFGSQREAIAKRDAILAAIATDSYRAERSNMTVAGAIEHWLENRKSEVKPSTSKTYQRISNGYIVGPLLIGTPADRSSYRQQ